MESPNREEAVSRPVVGRGAMLWALAGAACLWLFVPASVPWIAGVVGRYVVAVLTVLPRSPEAVGIVREEQTRTENERDAFEQFAQRVAATDPTDAPVQSAPRGDPADVRSIAVPANGSGRAAGDDSLEAIRNAYRETVMAVPHYEEDYGESLEENMAAELGPDVARAVADGEELLPQVRETLLEKSLHARKERADFLHALERERTSVVTARRTLRGIHETVDSIEDSLHRRPVDELVRAWERLEALEADCEEVLSERQSRIQAKTARMAPRFLQTYLYEPRPWTYPVLNDGLDSVARIRDAKRHVIDVFTRF